VIVGYLEVLNIYNITSQLLNLFRPFIELCCAGEVGSEVELKPGRYELGSKLTYVQDRVILSKLIG
jgi:hypothetical protein